MNKITLSGKLTKNAELRYTINNKVVTILNIYEEDEKTFLDITCWGELAELVRDLAKNDEISINGHVRKRSYEDKNKKKVYITEILADNVSRGTIINNENVKEYIPFEYVLPNNIDGNDILTDEDIAF